MRMRMHVCMCNISPLLVAKVAMLPYTPAGPGVGVGGKASISGPHPPWVRFSFFDLGVFLRKNKKRKFPGGGVALSPAGVWGGEGVPVGGALGWPFAASRWAQFSENFGKIQKEGVAGGLPCNDGNLRKIGTGRGGVANVPIICEHIREEKIEIWEEVGQRVKKVRS